MSEAVSRNELAPVVDVRSRPAPGGPDLFHWLAKARRRLPVFIAITVIVTVAVVLFAMQMTPQYMASTSLVIDPKAAEMSDVTGDAPRLPTDNNAIDTDVQILNSRALATEVVRYLGLTRDPEFYAPPSGEPGLRERIFPQDKPPAATAPAVAADAALNAATDALKSRTMIRRQGLTYVVTIAITSPDPVKAARIANAYADLYISGQVTSRSEIAQETNVNIDQRLSELQAEVEAADAAVQAYRIRNGLVAAQGATSVEQEVTLLNQQIATAEADLSEKEARLATARAQISAGGGGSDIGAALSSDTIRQLRQQEAEASRTIAQLNSRYGPLHPEVQKARGQLEDSQDQIQREINRIRSSLEADVQISRQRLNSLRSSLSRARGALASTSTSQVGLAELERKAEASRAIYEAFLNRSKETAAQQGITIPNARVVSRAQIPAGPVSPNMKLALAFGLAAGMVAGFAVAVLLELFANGLETGAEVERRLGVQYAGSIPLLASTLKGRSRKTSPHEYIVAHPLSAFAESFRALRTFIMLAGREKASGKVVAITSALPREGKSMTAVCLTRTMALAGGNVVLVDCDLRRRGASSLTQPGEFGLVDVLTGDATLDQALVRDEKTGAYILPTIRGPKAPTDLFATPAWANLIAELSERFDHVILDTAPVLAIAETRQIAASADMTVALAHWRRTPVKATDLAIDLLVEAGANLIGLALTSVDVRRQNRYGYGDGYYYYKSYAGYYLEDAGRR